MAFDEVRFPDDISFGSRGGPTFRTTVLELASGHEQRNRNWQVGRKRFNAAYGIKDREQMDALLAFFYARAGRFRGFRYKDWADYQVTGPQVIGLGDDVTTEFQVFKRYSSGGVDYDRTLNKLVTGTVTVYLDGVEQTSGVTVDHNTGVITFDTAPASSGGTGGSGEEVVSVECEFDVPVRFDTDEIEAEFEFWETQSIPSIPIIESRV